MEHAGKGSGHNAQSGDEAGKKHRPGTIPVKDLLRLLDMVCTDEEALGITVQKWAAAPTSKPVANVIAQRGSGNGDDDDPLNLEMDSVAVGGQEAGYQQDSFAGNRQTGVLQHHPQEDSPVAIKNEQLHEFLEDLLHSRMMGTLGPLESWTNCRGNILILLNSPENTIHHSLSGGAGAQFAPAPFRLNRSE